MLFILVYFFAGAFLSEVDICANEANIGIIHSIRERSSFFSLFLSLSLSLSFFLLVVVVVAFCCWSVCLF